MLWILIDWKIIDADNGCRLDSSTGRVSTRDIVQFVPMREVLDGEHIYFLLAYYCSALDGFKSMSFELKLQSYIILLKRV